MIVANSNDYHFHGDVIAYTQSNGFLTLKVTDIQGLGTFSSWITNLDGAAGGNGTSGTSGSSGSSGTSFVGTGVTNYLAKWETPSGLTSSLIIDDGQTLGINIAPDPNVSLYVKSTTHSYAGIFQNENNGGNGIMGFSNGVGIGGSVGVLGWGINSTSQNIGVWGVANSPGSFINIGGRFDAASASNNYSVQLMDGTETVAGRFLKNMNTNGNANWANILPENISGGSASYIPRYGSSGILSATSSVYNSDSGNVGIKNTSPSVELDVTGSIRISGTFSGQTINYATGDQIVQATLIFLSNNC